MLQSKKPTMKTTLLFFLTLCAVAVHAQRDFSDVEVRSIPVAKGIYMLVGAGGNLGVSAGADGILIVDNQFAPLAGKIESALAELDSSSPRFVLNTHHHGDHTGGNAVFAGKGATILAQSNVRKRLQADDHDEGSLPVFTFDESASVHFNGEEIRLIHHGPGHTDGDTVIHFTGANVVHMGDLFFNGRFPFVDLRNGGSVDGYIRSVETVLKRAPAGARIIPGHGDLASVEDLKSFHSMLVETVRLIREAKASGKTLEEIRETGLPEKYDAWGSGFISTGRWIETVYNDSA